ncbi:MAG: metal dependent phosphohydrolase [Sedimentibacter sp.]|nr:metal dependent phosphohydrolase [Sedimentibacter sp.]
MGQASIGDMLNEKAREHLVKSFEVKKTTNGKQYIDLELVDKTGEINAKIWEYSKETEEVLAESPVVKVRGEVLEWSGTRQLKVNKSNILSKYEKKLYYYPAAKKNHHSYMGGLLYHTLRMLQSGERLGQVYGFLKMDYIYAGVLLHDICKILEMDSDEYGVVSDYSMEGKLLGHIIQGIKEIEIEGEKIGLSREKSIILQHMVLSHHYEPEFGSPKKPMTPEAEILHFLDIIDARMFDFEHALEAIEPGQFTETNRKRSINDSKLLNQ